MPDRVRITDVSPRDGLQNEPGVIPTAEKVRLVELLCPTGVDEVEVTSFVSPKWVPQLGDAAEVLIGIARLLKPDMTIPEFSALVPNERGIESLTIAERAAHAELTGGFLPPLVGKIALFTAASETFNKRNTNATIAESIERFRVLLRMERMAREVRGYVSCAIACPFEGPVAPAKVADVAAMLVDVGVTELDLGDTIGAGTPETVMAMLNAVRDRVGDGWFERNVVTLHLHDTFGRAAECVKAALDLGVRSFDGSVAGLGGCPYASTPGKRAPGNISTELLVRTVEGAGFETGVDLERLEEAAKFAREIVGKARAGR